MVMGEMVLDTQLLVIGSGPGGYAAAFRGADLGLEVTMLDPSPRPGGECLYHGCIPSKTYLFLAELIDDARRAAAMGVSFGVPRIDLEKMRDWRDKVVDSLADGLASLCRQRGIELIAGKARFENSRTVRVIDSPVHRITFRDAVIATGSVPLSLGAIPFSAGSRVMSSRNALALEDIPETLLVIGGGSIGLELGFFYSRLGSRVRLVECEDRLLGGVDRDLVRPLAKRLEQSFDSIQLVTRVSSLKELHDEVEVVLERDGISSVERVKKVLAAIGRVPDTGDLGLERTRIVLGTRGEIAVDEQMRTAEPHIFAVGDVTGGIMYAHKAIREGKVAAEVSSGLPSAYDARAVPAVVYTVPQIAWCGLTEEQAAREKIPAAILKFPWKYSGRARTMEADDGLTKLLVEPETGRILGVGVVGRYAEGLIGEGVLAIEMGARAEDLALCIHPHPTLSETGGEAAELFLGNATHLLLRKP